MNFPQFKLLSKSYLDEAKWCSEKYAPSFKEHMEVSVMSSAFPTLAVVLLVGAGDMATREVFEWAIGVPDVVRASGEAARFLNDIASYKKGKNKKDVASSVECYAKEHGTSGEEAVTAIAEMAEHAWRRINRSCIEMDGALSLLHIVTSLPTSSLPEMVKSALIERLGSESVGTGSVDSHHCQIVSRSGSDVPSPYHCRLKPRLSSDMVPHCRL
nr:beta-selinene synthase [Cymbopogon martinii]